MKTLRFLSLQKFIYPNQLLSRPSANVQPFCGFKNCYSPSNQIIARSFHPCRLAQNGVMATMAVIATRGVLISVGFGRNGKYQNAMKRLKWIPVTTAVLLLAFGLEQAPNTSRIRLRYFSKEEEEIMEQALITREYLPLTPMMLKKDHCIVVWLQSITENLAMVDADDIHAPVRKQNLKLTSTTASGSEEQQTPPLKYIVNYVCDGQFKAATSGRFIWVHNQMLEVLKWNEAKVAVVLSHEVAHSVQNHISETHGFVLFFQFLGAIARFAFWDVTAGFGPDFNDAIQVLLSTNIIMESQTSYNRKLEYEADIVGLFILARAGYDPRVATEVWKDFEEFEQRAKKNTKETNNDPYLEGQALLDHLSNTWFGSTHPHNLDRIKNIEKYMDQAVALYEEAIRLNGKPININLKTVLDNTEPSD